MATPETVVGCPEALDALEGAAVEPRGLETLVRARTPADAAVVTHLASCDACAAEAARLRAIAALLREGLAPVPAADLRGRTLAYVRAVGRPRGESARDPGAAREAGPTTPPGPTVLAGSRIAASMRSGGTSRRRLALAGLAMAAVVVVAVGVTAFATSSIGRSELAAEQARSADLARTADIAMNLLGDGSAIRIPMAGGAGASGVAIISPASYAGAVVATGLPEPAAGMEYICYVVIDGQRRLVGRMIDSGTAYAWTGSIGAFSGVRPGSVTEYGVLLVPVGSDAVDGSPVVAGSV